MQRSDQQTLTLDDTTLASHVAGVDVSLWHWAQRYPKWPAILLGSLILTPILMFTVSQMFLALLPSVIIPTYWYMKRVREHFRHGDANPGVIISTSPILVAVLTDMTKGAGSYPMLHVRKERASSHWGDPAEVGTRLATVALYGVGEDDKDPYWGEFHPFAVEPVAADPEEAAELLASFSVQQWEKLESAVRTLQPKTEGLFPLNS